MSYHEEVASDSAEEYEHDKRSDEKTEDRVILIFQSKNVINKAPNQYDDQGIISTFVLLAHLSPLQLVESIESEVAETENVNDCC